METVLDALSWFILIAGIAFLFASIIFKRGDVSLFDTLRKIPNKYGFLWPLTRPEVYFNKRYVKYVNVLITIIVFGIGALFVLMLIVSRREGSI
jgi:hypothetical protein